MELLLNIIWLALTVPAFWIWRWKPALANSPQRFGRWRPYLLLGCALVLLFPVVSATDDLNAMRPEMEESSASKRLLKQAGAAKTMVWTHLTGSFLPETAALPSGHEDQFCGIVSGAVVPALECPAFDPKDSRAPPATIL